MIVIDAHCDAPSQMYRLSDFGIDNQRGQVDFPKMKRGGVDASFFAAYIPASRSTVNARQYADALLDTVERQVAANAGMVAFARSAADVRENKSKGLTSIILCIENASPLGESLSLLEHYYERGVRYVTLTHSADNLVGDSCTGNHTWGGLSPFGKDLVREMNRLGMIIDLAHASDDTIRDVLEISSAPVAYTHGCCRALASHRRNLPDELLKGIADGGGVAGMSIYPCFLSDGFVDILKSSGLEKKMWVEDDYIADPGNPEKLAAWWKVQDELAALKRPGVSAAVAHIAHAINVAGADHVGIGTDYCGIEVTAEGMETVESMPHIWDGMRAAGFDETTIEKVAGSNFLRLMDDVANIRLK